MSIVTRIRNCSCILTFSALLLSHAALAEENNIRITSEISHPYLHLSAEEPETVYLKIGLKGDPIESDASRPPMNIALVLDKSGSMSGEKIAHLREAANMMVDRLAESDTLSVIAYDNTAEILVPAGPLTDPEAVKAQISRITADGGTALYDGVREGAGELRRFISDNNVNRIILLSDGKANVGPSLPQDLGNLGASLSSEGITVSTIGLGLDFNEDLMVTLAARSDGFHQFAEHSEALTKFFDWEFGKTAAIVANDVEVEIHFAEGIRPVRILGRDGQSRIRGGKVTAKLNQIFSSHEIYLLVEAEIMPEFAGDNLGRIAETTVTYHDLALKKQARQSLNTSITITADKSLADKTRNTAVMIAATEQKAAIAQYEAIELRDGGRIREAQAKLEEMSETLKKAGGLFQSQKLKDYADTLKRESEKLPDDSQWNKNRKSNAETVSKVSFNVT